MPVIIPDDLAVRWVLEADGVFLIDQGGAARQDCRPLEILVVAVDDGPGHAADGILGLLSATPIQVVPTLATLGARRRGGPGILASAPWNDHWRARFDAVVVCDRPSDGGAPSSSADWDELRDLLDWSDAHARALLAIGWSAFAAIAHRYQLLSDGPATRVDHAVEHQVLRRQSYLMRSVDDAFPVWVRWRRPLPSLYLLETPGLDVVAGAGEADPYVLRTHDRRTVFCLHDPIPDPRAPPEAPAGRSHAAQMVANWINYYLYQPVSQATTSFRT